MLKSNFDLVDGNCRTKFQKILNSNKTPNIFSTYQLKITFKPLNFAQKPFYVFQNAHTLGFKTLKFQNIFIYSTP